jgi:hypothetical protein
VISKAYNGANGKKIAVIYNDDVYMIKFPPRPNTKYFTDLSYTNSCISEYIGCHIFESIGIPVQKTLLGTFTINGKEKIVCACKDFTDKDTVLFDFCSIKNTVIDSELSGSGSGTELNEIIETIKLQQKLNWTELMNFYFDMFIVDALVGNFDRHNGNFGFLLNKNTNKFEIAPIYDCGSCLYPRLGESVINDILKNEKEIHSRIYDFPLSVIKINGKKINYHAFITSLENEYCNEALKRIMPRIDISKINNIIENTPFISDVQKEFYKTFTKARYDMILQPAFNLLMEKQKATEFQRTKPTKNDRDFR